MHEGTVSVSQTNKDEFLKSVKECADYASRIWAAVLAVVLLLLRKETPEPADS